MIGFLRRILIGLDVDYKEANPRYYGVNPRCVALKIIGI